MRPILVLIISFFILLIASCTPPIENVQEEIELTPLIEESSENQKVTGNFHRRRRQSLPICSDTDGLDYFKAGKTILSYQGQIYPYPDRCTDGMLTESYCPTINSVGSQNIECANGCQNGACIAEPQPTPPETELAPTKPPERFVVLVVEDIAFTSLKNELKRYSQDITNDLGFKTKMLSYPATVNPATIKADLRKLWGKDQIEGVVIIGDIPPGGWYGPGVGEPSFPEDWFYSDMLDACTREETSNGETYYTYIYTDCTIKTGNVWKPTFWNGRLTPPKRDREGITLLRDYFDRNHAFRTGKITYKDALVYYPIVATDPIPGLQRIEQDGVVSFKAPESVFDGLKTRYNSITKIGPEFQEVISQTTGEKAGKPTTSTSLVGISDPKYLSELAKPYEYVLFNGHGLPTFTQQELTPEKIKKAAPQAMYYEFASCSVGRFTTEDYLAGWYLFGGKGLVVRADTTPIFGALAFNSRDFEMLGVGVPFGQYFLLVRGFRGTPLLGDPTLRLSKPKDEQPKAIVKDIQGSDLGRLNIGVEAGGPEGGRTGFDVGEIKFTISNSGGDDLILWQLEGKYSELPQFEIDYSQPSALPIPAIRIAECGGQTQQPYTIQPGKSKTCTAGVIARMPGRFEGEYYILTNEANNPALKIPFSGEGISGSTSLK